MGEGDVAWRVSGTDARAVALASGDELREVLLNVLENSRLAGARHVDVAVQQGIAPDANVPLVGLRPARALRLRGRKVPKPTTVTRLPFATLWTIASNTAFTASPAAVLLS